MGWSALKARLRLARVQTMALTALVPAFGAAVLLGTSGEGGVRGTETLLDLVLLFVTGCLFHVYGFVLNEWADLEVDRASRDLADKPLVSGAVPSREALVAAVASGLAGFVPLALVTLDPRAHGLYAVALLLGGVYDLKGKAVPLDHVLAGSLTALLLAGAVASGVIEPDETMQMTVLLVLVSLQYLQNLFENAIEGGLKDADHDAAAGASTFAAVLGTRVDGGRLVPSRAFTASSVTIKAVQVAVLWGGAVAVVGRPEGAEGWAVLAVLLLCTVAMLATFARFTGPVDFDRPRLKRTFSLHEVATFAAALTLFSPTVGYLQSLVFLALPLLWFTASNTILFGRPLEPGV